MRIESNAAINPRLLGWVALVLAGAAFSWLSPGWVNPEGLELSLRSLGAGMWLALLLAQCLCALLMLPSLPLVVASALLLPEQPAKVLALAMVGVLLSALMIYFNAGFLGLREHRPKRPMLRRARIWIRRRGSLALCLWCMAPFLPTDAACYVAASAAMPLKRYLPAILLGETVLCAAVIYGVIEIAA